MVFKLTFLVDRHDLLIGGRYESYVSADTDLLVAHPLNSVAARSFEQAQLTGDTNSGAWQEEVGCNRRTGPRVDCTMVEQWQEQHHCHSFHRFHLLSSMQVKLHLFHGQPLYQAKADTRKSVATKEKGKQRLQLCMDGVYLDYACLDNVYLLYVLSKRILCIVILKKVVLFAGITSLKIFSKKQQRKHSLSC